MDESKPLHPSIIGVVCLGTCFFFILLCGKVVLAMILLDAASEEHLQTTVARMATGVAMVEKNWQNNKFFLN